MSNKIYIKLLVIILFPFIGFADPIIDHYKITYFKNITGQEDIKDVKNIPQNSNALVSNANSKSIKSFSKYCDSYFEPWNKAIEFDLEKLKKSLEKEPNTLRKNYRLLPNDFFKAMENNANIEAISSLNALAVVINHSNLRVFPTERYILEEINSDGSGFPFDLAQDDYLNIGEPIRISHYTKDGKFAYVRTSSGATGFVLAKDIEQVDHIFVKNYQKKLAMLTKQTIAYFKQNSASTKGGIELYISSFLPIKEPGALLIPVKNAQGIVELQTIYVKQNNYIVRPLKFSKENVGQVVNELVNKPYGWGGNRLFHMDCARLVRNYFALFGINMPLLSRDQAKQGSIISLEDMDDEKKKETIKNRAIPYQSILYLPGHIGIYLGIYKKEPIWLHAAWSVRVFDQKLTPYCYIIGKSIISTLAPGSELVGFNPEKTLIKRITLASNLLE